MREIKFRFWDIKEQNYFYNIGFFPHDNGKKSSKGSYSITGDGITIDRFNKNFIVEQYTGLKDKNGVEIYEGDILGWNDSDGLNIAGPVKWNNEVSFWASDIGIGLSGWDPEDIFCAEYRIFGNIHQNPELLEDK